MTTKCCARWIKENAANPENARNPNQDFSGMAIALKRMQIIDCKHTGDPLNPDVCIKEVVTGRNLLSKEERAKFLKKNVKTEKDAKKNTKEEKTSEEKDPAEETNKGEEKEGEAVMKQEDESASVVDQQQNPKETTKKLETKVIYCVGTQVLKTALFISYVFCTFLL